jgi:hypothetical protein
VPARISLVEDDIGGVTTGAEPARGKVEHEPGSHKDRLDSFPHRLHEHLVKWPRNPLVMLLYHGETDPQGHTDRHRHPQRQPGEHQERREDHGRRHNSDDAVQRRDDLLPEEEPAMDGTQQQRRTIDSHDGAILAAARGAGPDHSGAASHLRDESRPAPPSAPGDRDGRGITVR